jgi:hypothetical protein
MAWQTINAGEVDANSPVSATLMGKVLNNLNWLQAASGIMLVNVPVIVPERTYAGSGGWDTEETFNVCVPASTSFEIMIEAKKSNVAAITGIYPVIGSYTGASTGDITTSYVKYYWALVANPGISLQSLLIKGKAAFGNNILIRSMYMRTL